MGHTIRLYFVRGNGLVVQKILETFESVLTDA
jgi:hypothetical protein